MKTRFSKNSRILVILVLYGFSLFFYSCDEYNFSQPQPSDKENINEFPKDYLGSWLSVDTTVKESHTEYHIHKDKVFFITHFTEPILKGAWPGKNSKGEYLWPPVNMQTMVTIRYDSLHRPVDTTENYLVRNNKIYEVNEKGLSKGYDYTTEGDTINMLRYDTIFIDLGANAFLRRLNKTMYVFNTRNTILGKDNSWWSIRLLQKPDKQSLKIWVCSSKKETFPKVFYTDPYSGNDQFYIDASFSASEILNMFNRGNFEIEIELYKDTGKDR